MKFVLKSARQFPVFLGEVLRISDNRVTDMRHMRTQLVRAAGNRFERKPGKPLRSCLHHSVISHCMACALLPMRRDTHERILFTFLLGEKRGYSTLARLWHARDQRPIDFARGA